jgi:hypothetical protein
MSRLISFSNPGDNLECIPEPPSMSVPNPGQLTEMLR